MFSPLQLQTVANTIQSKFILPRRYNDLELFSLMCTLSHITNMDLLLLQKYGFVDMLIFAKQKIRNCNDFSEEEQKRSNQLRAPWPRNQLS